MPIYEYRCLDCEHEFELMQRFSDPPAERCPACAGRVQRLISLSAFHLKGDGWYVTDYVRKGSKNGKRGDKSESEGSAASTTSETASRDTARAEATPATS